jgi:CBS-domain-containing membrane protein
MQQFIPKKVSHFLGLEFNVVSHLERVISALGGFIGILLVIWTSYYLVGATDATLIVASMGASAVLLFAVPHGALSQPWPLVMGHLVSALIGVTCARLVPPGVITAPLAVALAIVAMHYLRCIHPPGGATALTAVVGGVNIQTLGYQYVITPVLLNVMILLVVAIVVNYFFPWRRYPASLKQPKKVLEKLAETSGDNATLSHSDLEYALRQLDSFIDVTEADLAKIYTLAVQHSHLMQHLAPAQIKVGHYYSNGEYGEKWSIRQVVSDLPNLEHEKDIVVYKVVAGQGRRNSGDCTRGEFASWAKYEVVLEENSWRVVVS